MPIRQPSAGAFSDPRRFARGVSDLVDRRMDSRLDVRFATEERGCDALPVLNPLVNASDLCASSPTAGMVLVNNWKGMSTKITSNVARPLSGTAGRTGYSSSQTIGGPCSVAKARWVSRTRIVDSLGNGWKLDGTFAGTGFTAAAKRSTWFYWPVWPIEGDLDDWWLAHGSGTFPYFDPPSRDLEAGGANGGPYGDPQQNGGYQYHDLVSPGVVTGATRLDCVGSPYPDDDVLYCLERGNYFTPHTGPGPGLVIRQVTDLSILSDFRSSGQSIFLPGYSDDWYSFANLVPDVDQTVWLFTWTSAGSDHRCLAQQFRYDRGTMQLNLLRYCFIDGTSRGWTYNRTIFVPVHLTA